MHGSTGARPPRRSTAGSRPGSAPRSPNEGVAASPFSRLSVAHALSIAGDTFVTIALAGSLFFSISPSAAQGRVALSLVLTIAPFAVVAPLLGPAIDRVKGGRKLMVFAAASGRALTCLVMAEVVDGLLLFPAAFTLLVLSKTHSVAKSALVPTTVRSDELLVEANAKLSLTGVVVGAIAAGPAAGLLRLVGAAWVLRVGAIVFVACAVAALRIVQLRTEERVDRKLSDAELHTPGIRLAATAMAVLRGSVGFLTFLVAFSFRRADAPSWWFGLAIGASMVGSFLGAVVAPRVRERVGEERLITAALLTVTAGAVVAGRLQNRPATALLAGAVGLAANAGKLAFDALVQRDAPDAAQGRAFARFETEFQLVWVLAALVPVVITIPDRAGFFVLFAAGLVAAVSYVGGRRALVDGSPRDAAGVDSGD